MSFLKKGKQSQAAMKKADEKAAKAQEGYVNRFWMPKDAETTVTFLDGDIDEDGMLDIPTYLEHQLNLDGSWQNWFACTSETEPCPICEGDDNPTLVGVLTIIDHTEWESKKDGSTHKDEKKLFVCKRQTIKQLQKIATKRDGLKGITFEVSRVGEKAASVGDMFDFVQKKSPGILKKKYKDITPFDYEKVLAYETADELRKRGFGSLAVGSEAGVSDDDGYDEDL